MRQPCFRSASRFRGPANPTPAKRMAWGGVPGSAIAERFVPTVRSECPDWLPILSRRHLEHAPRVYADHDNRHGTHHALDPARRTREARPCHQRRARSSATTRAAPSSTSTTEPPHDTDRTIGALQVFMASDKASGMTGTTVDLSMGSLDD
jgi:hypothetical protein